MACLLNEGGWREKEENLENLELKVLKTNDKNCFYMQLGNDIYRQWGIEVYIVLQESKGGKRWRRGIRADWGKG